MEKINPCRHMKTLISALVDNKVTGIVKTYALWHIRNCHKCRPAFQALKELHARLSTLATKPSTAPETLSEDRRSKLESAWDRVEREST